MCLMEPNCVSINVGPVAGGNQKCELNNATEENHATFLLVNNPGYTYLAIEVTFYILKKLRWQKRLFHFLRLKRYYSWHKEDLHKSLLCFVNRIHAAAARA